MGADAEVFVFDYGAYKKEVVPAFLNLLRDGQVIDWLRTSVEKREMQPELWPRTDLAQFCTYLNNDLSWRSAYDLAYIYELPWEQRLCKSDDCPERERCSFHTLGSPDIAEQVNWLFDIAVSIRCLGRSQFVGRSRTVSRYSELLLALVYPRTIQSLVCLPAWESADS